MSEIETVSAIIPTFNYGRFVADAVESALAQDYEPPLEVIVVDDGSTDDTRERLAAYGARVRYIRQDKRGVSTARNTGIREAQGKWIAFLDADDLWHQDKTALQMRLVRDHGLDVVGSPANPGEMPLTLDPAPTVQRVDVRALLLGAKLAPSSAIVRRACFDAIGMFDSSLRYAEDLDMWLRLAARFAVGIVDVPCNFYRVHQGQASRDRAPMVEGLERVLDKFFREHPDEAEHARTAHAFMAADAAMTFLEAGARRRAAAYMLRSLARHPWPSLTGHPKLSASRRLKILVRTLIGDRTFRALTRR